MLFWMASKVLPTDHASKLPHAIWNMTAVDGYVLSCSINQSLSLLLIGSVLIKSFRGPLFFVGSCGLLLYLSLNI